MTQNAQRAAVAITLRPERFSIPAISHPATLRIGENLPLDLPSKLRHRRASSVDQPENG
jgi:hypothetical protein